MIWFKGGVGLDFERLDTDNYLTMAREGICIGEDLLCCPSLNTPCRPLTKTHQL